MHYKKGKKIKNKKNKNKMKRGSWLSLHVAALFWLILQYHTVLISLVFIGIKKMVMYHRTTNTRQNNMKKEKYAIT